MNKNKLADLGVVYKVLGHVTNGHMTLAECVSHYLREEGKAIVREKKKTDAVTDVRRILRLKNRFDNFLEHSFFNDNYLKEVITI